MGTRAILRFSGASREMRCNLINVLRANWTTFSSYIPDTTDREVETKEIIVGIVTDIDLLHYVTSRENAARTRTPSQGSQGSVEDN